jgi:hypothetical protein
MSLPIFERLDFRSRRKAVTDINIEHVTGRLVRIKDQHDKEAAEALEKDERQDQNFHIGVAHGIYVALQVLHGDM